MRKVIVLLVVGIFIASSSYAISQGDKAMVPIEKFGLGVKVGSAGNTGVNLAYAMKENIHIGTGVGLGFQTDDDNEVVDNSGMSFALSPFFRYIFSNRANFFPFMEFNFNFSQFPTGGTTSSSSFASFQVGGLWFPFPTVSLRGGVNALNYNLDSGQLGIGVLAPFLGIDWWM